jgi:hypothetical protein
LFDYLPQNHPLRLQQQQQQPQQPVQQQPQQPVQQQPQQPVRFQPIQTAALAPLAPQIPPNPPNRLVIRQVIGSVGGAFRPTERSPDIFPSPPPAPFIDYSNPDDPEDFDAEPPDL